MRPKGFFSILGVSLYVFQLPLPGIAPLPVGMFSTPTNFPWYHACIYPLPADLFNVPMSLHTLPIHYRDFNPLEFSCSLHKLIIFKRAGWYWKSCSLERKNWYFTNYSSVLMTFIMIWTLRFLLRIHLKDGKVQLSFFP